VLPLGAVDVVEVVEVVEVEVVPPPSTELVAAGDEPLDVLGPLDEDEPPPVADGVLPLELPTLDVPLLTPDVFAPAVGAVETGGAGAGGGAEGSETEAGAFDNAWLRTAK
jgi:hypothetical protein